MVRMDIQVLGSHPRPIRPADGQDRRRPPELWDQVSRVLNIRIVGRLSQKVRQGEMPYCRLFLLEQPRDDRAGDHGPASPGGPHTRGKKDWEVIVLQTAW